MLNPFEPGFFDDPYAQYRLVREQDPVHLSPIGAFALFRYEDVHRVLRDPSLSVEEEKMMPLAVDADPDIAAMLVERREGGTHNMLNLDPPDHHRLRRLVSKVFTPRMIEALRPRVQQLVDQHLDAALATGTDVDLIADLAFPLPFIVISEMLGIPEGRKPVTAARVVGRRRQDVRSDPHSRRDPCVVRCDRQHQRLSQRSDRLEAGETRVTIC